MARAAEAAREFEVAAQGITLRLRLPTALAMRRLVGPDSETWQVQERVLAASTIGWRGVPAADVVPGQAGDLPFDPRLVPAVLDRYAQAADTAWHELICRFAERRDAFEAAEKN